MDHAATSKLSYEFRCPVHGFIEVNDWERSVIDHPVFQRLRRIRQLGWTDYLQKALAHMLPDGVFPAPDDGGIDDYLEWDDWRVLAARGESPAAFDWRCIPRGGVAP